MNRYIMTDGVKSIDLPQFPNEAWQFYGESDDEGKEDFYGRVASVFRAFNITADVTASIPFALVNIASGEDYDVSDDWKNNIGFMPKPKELIRLWRMSLSATNSAYGFMENTKISGKNLRYIVPSTITPILDKQGDRGLLGFTRSLSNSKNDYFIGKKNPIFWMWRMDHTTELLPATATQFQAMCAAAGILYYSDGHIQAFFKRGGIKPTMLILKGMVDPTKVEKIESVWTKIISGGYKYLGKLFQGVDAQGGLEAQPIGEGVDNLKDSVINKSKVEDIALAMGIPLSIMLANSANYATAQIEYKSWYENSLSPWCEFMAEEMTEKLFKPLGYKFVFRPEMTDPGQEDEVSRAGAYSTYVAAKMKPSVAAQIVGIELPEGMEYDELDEMAEEVDQAAADAQAKLQQDKIDLLNKQSSSDNGKEQTDVQQVQDKTQKEKVVKFIPSVDQLHEMELWRTFAFRHFKKAQPLTFAFEVKTLPDEVAEGIRCALETADSEDAIKAAFDIDAVIPVELNGFKSDLAILELADAINKACENVTVPE